MFRGMFSLVGLLITVAIIAWAWSSYTGSVVKESRHAQDMAQSIAGNAPDGTPAIDSVSIEPEDVNGQCRDILVKSVVADGVMEKYYGLRAGDKVLEIGPLSVKDNGASTSMALMQQAYMQKSTLTILRDGQRLTLPSDSPPLQDSAGQIQQGLQRVPTH